MYRFVLILFVLNMSAWSSRIKEVLNLKHIHFSSINETLQNDSKPMTINVMPVALERWKNKLFLVTPRFKFDVPVTLSYINITSKIINIISIYRYYIHVKCLLDLNVLFRYGNL